MFVTFGGSNMTAALAIKSLLELAFILLLVYGFYKENKVIAFEKKLKMIIVVNYRRYKKRKRLEQMKKNRDFRVVEGKTLKCKKPDGGFHVA